MSGGEYWNGGRLERKQKFLERPSIVPVSQLRGALWSLIKATFSEGGFFTVKADRAKAVLARTD